MIILLSWVSFWLDPLSVPARVSLGVLTVLTMQTQSGQIATDLPKVSSTSTIFSGGLHFENQILILFQVVCRQFSQPDIL